MSMVDRMMEGVVRKNSPKKRVKLMPSHWNHQRRPWIERFFLQGEDTGLGGLSLRLWPPMTPTVPTAWVSRKVKFRQGKRLD